MDEQDRKALEDIKTFGCHVLNVMEGEEQPCFSYSIGIEKTLNQPELIIVGLKRELSHSIINNYRQRLASGEVFIPGVFYSDFIEGFDVTFIEMDKKHYKEYLGLGLWLYSGNSFKTYQLIWPTTAGIWPWNENKSEYYVWAQPILNSSGVLEKI
ncbi:MAG: DUF4262 domain-containing protein [Cellvibrio sp.]